MHRTQYIIVCLGLRYLCGNRILYVILNCMQLLISVVRIFFVVVLLLFNLVMEFAFRSCRRCQFNYDSSQLEFLHDLPHHHEHFMWRYFFFPSRRYSFAAYETFNTMCNSLPAHTPFDSLRMCCYAEINCVISVFNIHYKRQAMIEEEWFRHSTIWCDGLAFRSIKSWFAILLLTLTLNVMLEKRTTGKKHAQTNYFREISSLHECDAAEKKCVLHRVACAELPFKNRLTIISTFWE